MGVTAAATLASCLWAMWADLTAFDDVDAVIWLGIALAIPLVVWLVLAVLGYVKYTGWRRLGLLVPIFIALTVALNHFQIPGRIGWMISRSAMDRAAAECDAPTAGASSGEFTTQKIGVYTFDHVERETDGGCKFVLQRGYPVSRSGFRYLPHRKPIDGEFAQYHELGNSWYYYQ